MNTVSDRRVLAAMARHGLIKWPADNCIIPKTGQPHSYVDEVPSIGRSFMYKGRKFRLEYAAGCFYPFVTSHA